jgi:hypothetical protein
MAKIDKEILRNYYDGDPGQYDAPKIEADAFEEAPEPAEFDPGELVLKIWKAEDQPCPLDFSALKRLAMAAYAAGLQRGLKLY